MRKTMMLLLILLGVFCLTYQAYAADGDELTTTSWRIDSSGVLQPVSSSVGGIKVQTESGSTGDTLTAAESGKVFITTSGTNGAYSWFTLPTAANGLKYTVTAASQQYAVVVPSATDKIYYSTCVAGDRIRSAASTGDTVTLVGRSGGWYVTEMVGAWTDYN